MLDLFVQMIQLGLIHRRLQRLRFDGKQRNSRFARNVREKSRAAPAAAA
jgi:hypothetical protein